MKKNVPVRMCIACQKRESQKELIRLQKSENSLVFYSGKGRSFYLCQACLRNNKHIAKIVAGRMKLDIKSTEVVLKELSSNDKN